MIDCGTAEEDGPGTWETPVVQLEDPGHAEPGPTPTGEPSAPVPVDRELDQTREALAETRSEVASLREEMERIRRESEQAVAVRDQELAELRTATETMREEVRTIDTLRVDMDRLLRRDPPRE